MVSAVIMRDSPCDRCGKVSEELRPWKFSEHIIYRGRCIEKPWLCSCCFRAQKKLAWKRGYA